MLRSALLFATLCLSSTLLYGQGTPSITIRSLVLERLSKVSVADQQRIIQQIREQAFDSVKLDEIGFHVSERLRDALQQLGYFKAIVYEPRVTLVHQDKRGQVVDVLVAADEGEQYRLKDVVFKGGKAFATEQLRPLIPLRPGDIFNIENVRIGLVNLRDLYGQNGYVNFTPVPDTYFHDEQRTISLLIDMDEGAVFHVGKLNIGGEESEPGARTRLSQAWKKYEGQVYVPGVLDKFLQDVHARPGAKWEDFIEISQDNVNHLSNAYISLGKPFQ